MPTPYAMSADLWIQKIQLEIITPCEKLLSELPLVDEDPPPRTVSISFVILEDI